MHDRLRRAAIWTAIAWPVTVAVLYLVRWLTGLDGADMAIFAVVALPCLFVARLAMDGMTRPRGG